MSENIKSLIIHVNHFTFFPWAYGIWYILYENSVTNLLHKKACLAKRLSSEQMESVTPSHGRAKAGRPARSYIQQQCADTGYSLENVPGTMGDRDGWRERVREIRASGTRWWWWWMKTMSTQWFKNIHILFFVLFFIFYFLPSQSFKNICILFLLFFNYIVHILDLVGYILLTSRYELLIPLLRHWHRYYCYFITNKNPVCQFPVVMFKDMSQEASTEELTSSG